MNKFFYAVLAVSILVMGLAQAATISFVSPVSGVDDSSGFSGGDSGVDVGTNHLDILGGTGDVNGFSDGVDTHLTHRLTRGLGVKGGEFDEVDSHKDKEEIVIKFDTPKLLSYLEVRSLFDEEAGTEEGDVDMFLGGSFVTNEHLVGSEPTGEDGSLAFDYSGSPILVDKLVFYVNDDEVYTSFSEFAVAKLIVNEPEVECDGNCPNDVPEFTTIGAGLVLAGAGAYIYRKRSNK